MGSRRSRDSSEKYRSVISLFKFCFTISAQSNRDEYSSDISLLRRAVFREFCRAKEIKVFIVSPERILSTLTNKGLGHQRLGANEKLYILRNRIVLKIVNLLSMDGQLKQFLFYQRCEKA